MDQSTSMGAGLFIMFIYLGIIGVLIAAQWKLFVKAGKPGWAAIVPIYNIIVLLEIVGRPAWHFLLMFIPLYNIYFLIVLCSDVCKSYGKTSTLDVILYIFFGVVYVPYMGFSSNVQYVGPYRASIAAAPAV